MGGLQFI